jgi:methyltransferase (TIGR00027 family)
MANTGKIENISDTARWVAVYRAQETERKDAIFRDPLARILAGEKGAEIVKALPHGRSMAWVIVVRTAVFDELILKAVAQGADLVVNLAAGLDTRPYRLNLPAGLRWVEVDLPGILDYKEAKLAGEKPRCRLERRRADLSDPAARREVFSSVAADAKRALVITEGLLIYLTEKLVQDVARDLRSVPAFHWWLIDHATPALLKMIEKQMNPHLPAGSEFKFSVENAGEFFGKLGWQTAEERLPSDEARRLKREMPFMWLFRLMSFMMPAEKKEMYRRMSAYSLLERGP